MTQDEATIIVACVSAGIAVVALWFAQGANSIASSATWAEEVFKRLLEELINAAEDANYVRMFCTVPFRDADTKTDMREKLRRLRDESMRRLALLDHLMDATDLQNNKSARDKIDDSFWENDELLWAEDRGKAKLDEYKKAADTYVRTLRKRMVQLTSKRRKMLKPRKP